MVIENNCLINNNDKINNIINNEINLQYITIKNNIKEIINLSLTSNI